jgi:hypothetical protein
MRFCKSSTLRPDPHLGSLEVGEFTVHCALP